MTSIATYLASLTGAAPQEGQKATLANATGGVGIFAALLESSEATQGIQGIDGETTLPPSTLELPVTAPSGQVTNDDTVEGAVLRDALTDGLDLPQDGAEIEAAIIDAPIRNLDEQRDLLQPAGKNELEKPAPLNIVQTAAPEAAEKAVVLQDKTTPIIVPGDETTAVEAHPQRQNPAHGETHAPPAGLENALERASQSGKAIGLQAVLDRTAQARGEGLPAQANGLGLPAQARGEGLTAQARGEGQPVMPQGEKTSEASRIPVPGASDDTSTIKPDTTRPEVTPRGSEITQRLIKPGNGQPVIQIQERTVGENAGASSPPTLTVSVQASAASPGPASANAPHVPVSALAVHIAQQASNGARRFDIRLDPPELGRIEVRLDVSREGQVMTHMVVERAETLDLLQRDARQLERALQDAGLNTSEEDMKFSLKDQGLAQGEDDHLDSEDDMGARDTNEEDNDLARVPGDTMPPPTRYLATSGVDIRI
jgi:chemotaxis protein MotD